MSGRSNLKYCSLKLCKTNSNSGLSLFYWPKSEITREKWKKFMISQGKSNVNNFKHLKLCELHFDLCDIIRIGKKTRLNEGAEPKYANNVRKKLKLININ